jgi:hypothetical protein
MRTCVLESSHFICVLENSDFGCQPVEAPYVIIGQIAFTGTNGTYGDSHLKASNDCFVPRMFPSSSQCVLSMFTKFPRCSSTCSKLHLSLSPYAFHRRFPLGTYVGDKIVGLIFLAPQPDFATCSSVARRVGGRGRSVAGR